MPKGTLPLPLDVPVRGLNKATLPHQAPAASVVDGLNMVVDDDGKYVVRPGYSPIAASGPGARILGLFSYRNLANETQLLAATQTGWWRLNFATRAWVDITGTANTGDPNLQNRFVSFSQAGAMWAIGVNGVDATRRWDSAAATYVTLTNAPIARDVEVVARRVVMVHTTESGTRYLYRVRWSSADDMTTWGANNFIDIADHGAPLVAIARLSRQSAICYRADDAWLLTAQPGSDATAFRIDSLGPVIGPAAPAAVIEAEGLHYFFGLDGRVYRFDGVRPVILSAPIHSLLQSELNPSFVSLTHGGVLQPKRQLWWWFVSKGDTVPKTAIVYHLDQERWEVKQSFAEGLTASAQMFEGTTATWNAMTGTWNSPDTGFTSWDAVPYVDELVLVVGTDAGQVHRFGRPEATSDNGTAISFSWDLPIQQPDPYKTHLLDEVESYFATAASSQAVTMTAKGYLQPQDAAATILTQAHTISTGGRYRAKPAADYRTYYPALQVTYSGSTSNNTLVKWGGGVAFTHPEEDGVP